MSELGDFLKAVAEAKADYEQNDPKGRQKKEIQDTIKMETKVGLGDLFKELASLKSQVEQIENQEEIPVLENEEMWSSRVIDEEPKLITRIVIPESNLYLPEPESINEDMGWGQKDIQQYAKSDAFKKHKPVWQPPNGDAPELKGLKDQIKMLEQWISRIASTGPGSGEVNFRYLDDVDRSTMNPGNDNWVLEYNSANGHVQFTEHVGPIRTIKLNTTGPQQALVAGQMAWNPVEDCLDVKQADGTTWQGGLEQYIRVMNTSANTMTNGTVVMFAGVEDTDTVAVPIISKFLADSTVTPLLLIGVLTTDIVAGGVGRATVFGYVRDIDTTGADVGETWAKGDLLWGHPTIAGKMTKVRPTAPNVSTSIAAVTSVGTTDGQILVRPTIWPRLYYGDWYDITNQTAALPNTAYAVKCGQQGQVSGFEINAGGTEIKALNAGRYNFEFSLQVTSTNSSLAKMYIWYRKNGQDVANSATIITVRENGGRAAPAWNFPVLMNANDTFSLMWAVDSVNVSLAHEASTGFCPAIPSVILTVAQTNL